MTSATDALMEEFALLRRGAIEDNDTTRIIIFSTAEDVVNGLARADTNDDAVFSRCSQLFTERWKDERFNADERLAYVESDFIVKLVAGDLEIPLTV
jgi:hypothetical protein